MALVNLVPDGQLLLAMEPEELAGILLEHFHATGAKLFNRRSFGQLNGLVDYPENQRPEIAAALMEAWSWLEHEGILVPKPGADSDFVVISRRGMRLRTREDLAAFRRASLLPREVLHPTITQKVWPSFLRGDYDAAVFLALKEVEVHVREAAGLGAELYGVSLVRKAFDPAAGSLTDTSALPGEREALSSLFAGAIGSYKNPHSHRRVSIDAIEAVEIIVLASHLFRIVESRCHSG